MAGIYFHIPFCKQACHYCDFHFTTSLQYKDDLLKAMLKELEMRKDYLAAQTVESIYFGGGTPSLLNETEISTLIDAVGKYYPISSDVEITLEANPDDLNAIKVADFRKTAINRFSIGIQSFFEEDLKWMNRAHNASEAESSIKRVQDAGFENITADLIYGFPLLTDEKWTSNIQKLTAMEVPHISAYSMTVEPRTALGHFIKSGKEMPMNEGQSNDQFFQLINQLEEKGYEQYEISNFAKAEAYSKHNSNYWRGVPYLGIGPSAHSFNKETRHWNISNNPKYIAAIERKELPSEEEILTPANRINEYIMTSLRTKWGMDLNFLNTNFDPSYFEDFHKQLEEFSEAGKVKIENNHCTLTAAGKILADHIASELFVEDENYL
jgi:oxygen-independent coproporphyrinogen-3 oxidase